MLDSLSSPERRRQSVRNDLNELVRDESGRISGSKIGTYAGQGISAHILLKHSHELIDHWDSLAIMFVVLIAPEILKRLMIMKYSGGADMGTTTTTDSTTQTSTRKVTS